MWTARPKIVTLWPFKEMFAYSCSRDKKKKGLLFECKMFSLLSCLNKWKKTETTGKKTETMRKTETIGTKTETTGKGSTIKTD